MQKAIAPRKSAGRLLFMGVQSLYGLAAR